MPFMTVDVCGHKIVSGYYKGDENLEKPVLALMYSRWVIFRRYDPITIANHHQWSKCADCGAPTKVLVVEIEPHFVESDWHKRVWGWCGCCDVGG